jgi:hypothetical protein
MLTTKSTLWKMKQTRREKDIPDRMFLARALAEEGIPLDPPLREAASDANIPGQSPLGEIVATGKNQWFRFLRKERKASREARSRVTEAGSGTAAK